MDHPSVAALGSWIWFAAAALLMILELALPGMFLLWFGIAAAATGLAALLFDLSWQREILLFAVLALVCAMAGRDVMRRMGDRAADQPFLNRRAEALIGREFQLDEPIAAGTGRIRVDDTVWRVRGMDAPAGARVRVDKAEGATLVVSLLP
jgi:membrane protein implicated in regulation of membrane protease activity